MFGDESNPERMLAEIRNRTQSEVKLIRRSDQ